MPQSYPADVKEALLVFHFADRLKAELLIASRLLNAVMQLQGAPREGGSRIFLEYLKGLEQEINLGSSMINDPDMIRVKTVMTGLIGMADAGMFPDMQQHLTWVLTVMTTFAQRSMEMLLQHKLL
jgi:hypothetical protein